MMGKGKVKKVDYEGQLEDVIGFTADDLEANRAGQLSAEQHAQLMSKEFYKLGGGFLCGVICCVIGFYAVMRGIPSNLTIPAIGIVFVLGYLAIKGLEEGVSLYIDLSQARVDAIEGYVRLDIASKSRNQFDCSVSIGVEHFSINKDTFLAFKNGDPYTIYYLPRSKTILSVEWLRD